jgi:hypothetical protein
MSYSFPVVLFFQYFWNSSEVIVIHVLPLLCMSILIFINDSKLNTSKRLLDLPLTTASEVRLIVCIIPPIPLVFERVLLVLVVRVLLALVDAPLSEEVVPIPMEPEPHECAGHPELE